VLKSVEGVLEPAPAENARVLVTFFPTVTSINLVERGIDPAAAGELRGRLGAFVEGWDRPEMDVYDELSSGRC